MGEGVTAFIDPTEDQLRHQWLSIVHRTNAPEGKRQVNFVPCEVVMSHCASLLMDHSKYGSGSAHRAEFPVQHLARLFKRPPTSILAKMANLDGTRSNGGKFDPEVASRLADFDLLQGVYLRNIDMARSVGIGHDALPDFLGIEGAASFVLEGQDELDSGEIETALVVKLEKWERERPDVPVETTERLLTAAVRVGQHRFAQKVLKNHDYRCVFCGMSGEIAGKRRPRMLAASHIKPWRDSTDRERLDHRNGFTACPTHDVAFDTGLITVDEDLSLRYAPGVEDDLRIAIPLRRALGKPPLHDRLQLARTSVQPDIAYLQWHREKIFVAV
ncbi:HNH endonuclease [Rhodococcus sp. BP-252]|nr:HNH endonuclease [Rhodococcus sp. BP-320]MBY6419042.1 HNH endonuclease [Rhodococcus sp. BP-321]MBY6423772.1 HNH endonuclease [Rhodococcus sp. BP-324]MBY6429076.1 HNH endonuclease [Rhodococcus sp. BP-323]MBY6434082.1 HNH endonuclease [Rhodococcus sp. BP-322]MBY6443015.1 HNH endonuclease [Rhodococcus sp. BP-319]MBY6447846.1 HNH endonuclease [Rhodococcus sp. BP-318]MBY6452680.1 HNH endonuclease [Rhodococcus sp. BP-315]MBY6457352.1 HNH endonuclease [Rhodococcus sp. BP-277]MBY6462486.1 HNH e